MTEILTYWFAKEPKLPNGDGRPVIIGETLKVEPPIKCCVRGLHGSIHPFDALQYAPGPLLYRTRHSGMIDRQEDKLCSSERAAIAVIDATAVLRLHARKQALSVLHMWTAPEVVKIYIETGDENIRDAAWAAAWAAAWEMFKETVEAAF
ncbi:MAG TPA: hypothetical protein VGR84_18740 [Candidatus Acidoferrales bacterium]|nr:hypothetical protein [Candidatus Acidoferrales bacterium]